MSPPKDQETFWTQIRESQALGRLVEDRASKIPQPDWDAVFSGDPAARSAPRRRVAFYPAALGVAAACFLAVFLWPQGGEPSAPSHPGSVVDQVFRSTARWDTAVHQGGGSDPGAFSSVLKSIDAGFARWDEPVSHEE